MFICFIRWTDSIHVCLLHQMDWFHYVYLLDEMDWLNACLFAWSDRLIAYMIFCFFQGLVLLWVVSLTDCVTYALNDFTCLLNNCVIKLHSLTLTYQNRRYRIPARNEAQRRHAPWVGINGNPLTTSTGSWPSMHSGSKRKEFCIQSIWK